MNHFFVLQCIRSHIDKTLYKRFLKKKLYGFEIKIEKYIYNAHVGLQYFIITYSCNRVNRLNLVAALDVDMHLVVTNLLLSI